MINEMGESFCHSAATVSAGADAAWAAAWAALEAAHAARDERAARAALAAACAACNDAAYWDAEAGLLPDEDDDAIHVASRCATAVAEAEAVLATVERLVRERGLDGRDADDADDAGDDGDADDAGDAGDEGDEGDEGDADDEIARLEEAFARRPADGAVNAAWAEARALGDAIRSPWPDGHDPVEKAGLWRDALSEEMRDALRSTAHWAADRLEAALQSLVDCVSAEDNDGASQSALFWLLDRDELESVAEALFDREICLALDDLDREAAAYATTWLMTEVPPLPEAVNLRFREAAALDDPKWWTQFAD